MICEKCGEDFSNYKWESGKKYLGIEDHHNPPEFMVEKWDGTWHKLCHKHHRELHDEIIKIINKGNLKFVKSEYWAWIKILPIDRPKIIKEVMEYTKRWLNDS